MMKGSTALLADFGLSRDMENTNALLITQSGSAST